MSHAARAATMQGLQVLPVDAVRGGDELGSILFFLERESEERRLRVFKALEPEIDPALLDAAGKLAYNTVYAVNLAVQREDISPYHWVYFPEKKYLLHRISYPGNFSPSMVPAGWSSITVEVSASPSREVPTGDKLIERVLDDLKDAKVLLDGEQVEVISVLTLKPAYIIYNHDHRKSVDSLHDFLKENSIYSCGRFGEWEYLNMDKSILSGKRVVEESFSRLNAV